MAQDKLGSGGHLHTNLNLFFRHLPLVALDVLGSKELATLGNVVLLVASLEHVRCLSKCDLNLDKISNTEL